MSDFYKKIIYPFAVNLVENYIDIYGYDRPIDITDINEDDVEKFASILLSENPEEFQDLIWNDDVYSVLIAAIRTGDEDDKILFSEKVIKNVVSHFHSQIEEILNQVHSEVVTDFYEFNGKNFIKDNETGEGRWV